MATILERLNLLEAQAVRAADLSRRLSIYDLKLTEYTTDISSLESRTLALENKIASGILDVDLDPSMTDVFRTYDNRIDNTTDQITSLSTRTTNLESSVAILSTKVPNTSEGIPASNIFDDVDAFSFTVSPVTVKLFLYEGSDVARVSTMDFVNTVYGGKAPYTFYISKLSGGPYTSSTSPISAYLEMTSIDVGTNSVYIKLTDSESRSTGEVSVDCTVLSS